MGRRAITSGLKAGLTAGFAPEEGNIYSRIAGRENPGKYFNPFRWNQMPGFDYVPEPLLANKGGMIGQNPNTLLGYLG